MPISQKKGDAAREVLPLSMSGIGHTTCQYQRVLWDKQSHFFHLVCCLQSDATQKNPETGLLSRCGSLGN